MADDILIGLGLDDNGDLKQLRTEVEAVDASFANLIARITQAQRQLDTLTNRKVIGPKTQEKIGLFSSELAQAQASIRELKKLRADKVYAGQRAIQGRYESLPANRQTPQLLSQVNQAIKTFGSTNGTLLVELKKIEQTFAKMQKLQYQQQVDFKRDQQLSKVIQDKRNPTQYLAGLTQAEVGALRRRAEQNVRSASAVGNSKAAESNRLASQVLVKYLKDLDAPAQKARREALASALGTSSALESLLSDANPAKLKAYRRTAGAQARQLADAGDYSKSSQYEQLVGRLDKALKDLQPSSPAAKVREATANQRLAEIEDRKVKEYASRTYRGKLVASPEQLQGMSLLDLESRQADARLQLKAQRVRVGEASAGALPTEREALQLLEKQTRELENQLAIRRRIDRQDAEQNNPELQQRRSEAQATSAAQRNSYEANRQRVLGNIEQSRIRREVDGGADMFRNQGILLRNYALMGAGVGSAYSTGSFIVELDSGFKQLQAILALTNNDMATLKSELIEISELTKFDSVEVVDTAVILGQAGLSKDQIRESIAGITLFATAVGTDLKSAVDLATSTLGVFNIEASRMPEVVDKLTISMNQSKLNLDKVSLGIQYAGNIAEQSNVSFEDTVAALAAMANSGVKSGSTLGTGLRQILITLQAPTDKFKQKIADLGLNMSDLDLKTHSLTDVMATLSNSGFTVVDAMKTMEVRAASAFGAFANNIDTARNITEAMNMSGSAAQANEIQMGALANQWARFASIAKSIFYTALEPFVAGLTKALETTSDWLSELKQVGGVLNTIISGMVVLGTLKTAVSVGRLGGRLLGGLGRNTNTSTGAASGVGAVGAVNNAAVVASVASMFTSGSAAASIATVVRTIIGGPWIWGLSLAAAGATYAKFKMDEQKTLDDRLDRAKFVREGIESRISRNETGATAITNTLSEAYYRQNSFTDPNLGGERLASYVSQLNSELRNLGFYMDPMTASFDALISKLQETRGKLLEFRDIDLVNQASAGKTQARVVQEQLKGRRSTSLLGGLPVNNWSSNSAANTAGYANNWQLRRRTEALRAINPELGNIFGIQYGGKEPSSPYRDMISSVQSQDLMKLGSEGIKPLQNDFQALLTTLVSSKTKLTDAEYQDLAKKNGLSVEDISDLFTETEAEINTILQDLQEVSASLKPSETLNKNKSLSEITEKLRKEYETQYLDLVSDTKLETDGKLNNPLVRKDPLKAYQEFTTYRAEAKARLDNFDQLVDARAKELVAQNPNLNPGDVNTVLTSLGFGGGTNRSNADLLEGTRSLSKPALAAARSRNNTEDTALQDEIELLKEFLADSIDRSDIDELRGSLVEALRKQTQNALELAKLEAAVSGDDVTAQENVLNLENQLKTLESDVDRLAGRSLTRLDARDRFAAGDFSAGDRSLFGNREQAKAARAYFAETRSSESEALNAEKVKATAAENESQRLRAEAERLKSEASDTGLGYRNQALAYTEAIPAIQAASEAFSQSLRIEMLAVQENLMAKALRLYQLDQSLSDNGLDQDTRKAYESEINALTPEIEAGRKKLEELKGALNKNTVETKNQTNQMRGQARLIQERRFGFNDEERRRVRAYNTGQTFETDQQIGEGRGQTSSMGTVAGGWATQVDNAFGQSLQYANDSLSRFDALTEATLGFRDILTSTSSTMSSFFTQFVMGSIRGADAFRAFGASILQSMAQVASEIAANALMKQVFAFALSAWGPSTDAVMAGGPNLDSGFQAAWKGGLVQAPKRYYGGGEVTGGRRSRDSTLIHAAQGEFVLQQSAVDALGLDTVRTLNNLDKGTVKSMRALNASQKGSAPEGDKTVNIWVVSPEEQQKSSDMNENSILVVVDSALSRNSKTKTLVKRISMGDL